MPDVIIVGGGIVGTAAAYNLARSGVDTLLIDRQESGRATDAGAGILSFATLGLGDDQWFKFAMQCGAYYGRLISELADAGAEDAGYAVTGELIVAVDEDEESAFEVERRHLLDQQRRQGQPPADSLTEITSDDARELFPPLAEVRRALYYRDGARVDGRLLMAAMRQAAENHGLNVRQARVDRLVIAKGAAQGVGVGGEMLHADRIIIAGGAWSAMFGEALGVKIPVFPMRGQIIHLSLPGTDTSQWPLVHAFHGHYAVSWPDSRVAVGATREARAGFVPQPTVSGVREVLDEALRVMPGLADAHVEEIRVGLRPAITDGLPALGPVPGVENVFLATGFAAIGLQIGPYSGKLAADWARGLEQELDVEAFSVRRFAT